MPPIRGRSREYARGLTNIPPELAPEAAELAFWAGLGVAAQDLEAGVALVGRAAAQQPSWLVLLERLPTGLWPTAEAVRDALSP